VALWTGLQLVAVALAEVMARAVFWWLEPHCRLLHRSPGPPSGDEIV